MQEFETNQWNASDLNGIKSCYQLRCDRSIEPLLATPITEATIVMMDHPCYCPCCIAMQFEQFPYRQITNPTTHTIKRKNLEEPKVAKLPLDYHGKLLEFYRKGGKPTIQKDVVVICLKTLPRLADEDLPMGSPDFVIMKIYPWILPARGWY